MPLKNYGVLKSRAMNRRFAEGPSPHYQVLVTDETQKYRLAINVKSQENPSELLYFVDENFSHPIIKELQELDFGFHELARKPGGLALDYIRGNLFDSSLMKSVPYDLPGPDNDLNELLELYMARAIVSTDAILYPFGEQWGPEEDIEDKHFGFLPGNSMHNLHMNQGSVGRFKTDNGVFQDGGMLIYYPARSQWVGIFLAFQSQSFHTDDTTGHKLDVIVPTTTSIRIFAAMVNPVGDDLNQETVSLINTSPHPIDLNGWTLADRIKRQQSLKGIIYPGEVLQVALHQDGIQLGNNGGMITLLDDQGLKIDGVAYTKQDAQSEGWTVLF
jgi:uncharacterized protein YukJ